MYFIINNDKKIIFGWSAKCFAGFWWSAGGLCENSRGRVDGSACAGSGSGPRFHRWFALGSCIAPQLDAIGPGEGSM